jgi:hypothetical protein
MYTKEKIKEAVIRRGGIWFNDKVNIVGIRTKDATTNTFNDFITLSYGDIFKGWEATTDPGLYWLRKPGNVKGCAILVPGQYVDAWQIGTHSGYEALVQCRPVAVYRDNNRDDYLNFDSSTIDRGYFGINIHRAHASILQFVVEKYSAGCQVFRRRQSFEDFMLLIKCSNQKYFTYTLLNETEILSL